MFFERFDQLRKEKGITVKEFTSATNLPYSSVWAWQNGSQPTAERIVIVADYFEVSTDYLLCRTNDAGIIETNANLKPDEAELLSIYKKLNFQNKNQLLGFAKALAY